MASQSVHDCLDACPAWPSHFAEVQEERFRVENDTCGNDWVLGAAECRVGGDIVLCINCGAEISDKAVMCVHCGAMMRAAGHIPRFGDFDRSGIARRYECTEDISLSPQEVDARMCNLSAYGVYFDLVGRNVLADGFEYSLQANIGCCSWGECIYVGCFRTGGGSRLNIFSKCAMPVQLLDWGKNRRNVNALRKVFA